MNVKKIFLHNLKTIMQADELTPRDVYSLFWLSEKEQDNLENFGSLPCVGTVQRIAEYANISVYSLFHQAINFNNTIRKENVSQ